MGTAPLAKLRTFRQNQYTMYKPVIIGVLIGVSTFAVLSVAFPSNLAASLSGCPELPPLECPLCICPEFCASDDDCPDNGMCVDCTCYETIECIPTGDSCWDANEEESHLCCDGPCIEDVCTDQNSSAEVDLEEECSPEEDCSDVCIEGDCTDPEEIAPIL